MDCEFLGSQIRPRCQEDRNHVQGPLAAQIVPRASRAQDTDFFFKCHMQLYSGFLRCFFSYFPSWLDFSRVSPPWKSCFFGHLLFQDSSRNNLSFVGPGYRLLAISGCYVLITYSLSVHGKSAPTHNKRCTRKCT